MTTNSTEERIALVERLTAYADKAGRRADILRGFADRQADEGYQATADADADGEEQLAADLRAALEALTRTDNDVSGLVEALDWRVPDEDELGHENYVLTAPGVGGTYDIGEQSDGYILWWADDPFTFQEGFASIDEAKAAAQADWERNILAALAKHRQSNGGVS